MLIAFGGLPGTGKTTITRALAHRCEATYLRIDTIEQAMRAAGVLAGEVGPAGYMIAYAVAEANLRLGRIVVADSVNPLAVTREAWRGVAQRAETAILEVELVCSDPVEHRRRVETRVVDVAGLVLPTWIEVSTRHYEPWPEADCVIDTARTALSEAVDRVWHAVEARQIRKTAVRTANSGSRMPPDQIM